MGRTSQRAWVHVAAEVRRLGRETNAPCSLCRGALGPIDYRTRAEADREAREQGQWWLVGAYRPLALNVDHIVPHSAGGPDTLANAAPSHAACNARAQAKGLRAKRNTQAANTPSKPVVGTWQPLDQQGSPLPGRAVPGQRTATHVFVAASGGDPGASPLPPSNSAGPVGIADTPRPSEPPKDVNPDG